MSGQKEQTALQEQALRVWRADTVGQDSEGTESW